MKTDSYLEMISLSITGYTGLEQSIYFDSPGSQFIGILKFNVASSTLLSPVFKRGNTNLVAKTSNILNDEKDF